MIGLGSDKNDLNDYVKYDQLRSHRQQADSSGPVLQISDVNISHLCTSPSDVDCEEEEDGWSDDDQDDEDVGILPITIKLGLPIWEDKDDNVFMTQLLLLGKFEYTGGPIFKVVLEC